MYADMLVLAIKPRSSGRESAVPMVTLSHSLAFCSSCFVLSKQLAIFFVIFGFILSKTKFGRSIFAIGGNAEAARLAGINANRVKTICYVMTAMFAALSGIILASRMNSGAPAASPNLHFDAITAANLGGVSMVGGIGSIPSVVLGVLLVQAFNSGLNMVNVSSYWQYVARGLLLFASLAIDFYRQKARAKRLLEDSMKNL